MRAAGTRVQKRTRVLIFSTGTRVPGYPLDALVKRSTTSTGGTKFPTKQIIMHTTPEDYLNNVNCSECRARTLLQPQIETLRNKG